MMNRKLRNSLAAAVLVLAVAPAASATTADPLTLHLLEQTGCRIGLGDECIAKNLQGIRTRFAAQYNECIPIQLCVSEPGDRSGEKMEGGPVMPGFSRRGRSVT
jgi:hypothetical protein